MTTEKNITMYKVFASNPDKRVGQKETSDPLTAEKEYLKMVQTRDASACHFVIDSRHPEVPNASFFLGEGGRSPFDRESNPERRLSMWGDPERAKVLTGKKWHSPTVWQCKALRQRLLDPNGGEIPLRLLALKVGYEKRSFTFFFAENNNRAIPFLVWSKLLEATGNEFFKVAEFSLLPFEGV